MGANYKGHKTTQAYIDNAHRRAKAINLRLAGLTYEEIAAECGWNSRQAAQVAIRDSIMAVAGEPSKELLALHIGRLDKMFGLQYARAVAGDLDAVNGCLKIMERQARLMGMDAPVKTDNKTELSATGGVLVVPGIMDEASWLVKAKESQTALAAKEAQVLQAPQVTNKTRRRVEE